MEKKEFNFMLGVEMKKRIRDVAKYFGKSMSDIINEAILKEVERLENVIKLP